MKVYSGSVTSRTLVVGDYRTLFNVPAGVKIPYSCCRVPGVRDTE